MGGPPGPVRKDARPPLPDRHPLPGRTPGGRGKRRPLEGGDGTDPDVRDLPRRDLRRSPREAGMGVRRFRRPAVVRGEASRAQEGRPHRSRGPTGPSNPGAQARQGLQDPGGRHRGRPRPEHGGLGPAEGAGPRGDDGHPPSRRGARQGRELLHGEPPQGEGHAPLHAQGRRCRDLRAALHVLRLPLRGLRRLPGRGDAGSADRDRRALADGARGGVRDLEAAREPAPAQHRLGAEGELPRRPHRLPAA